MILLLIFSLVLLCSVFVATKCAAKAMLQTSSSKPSPSGSIIATASVGGLRSNAGSSKSPPSPLFLSLFLYPLLLPISISKVNLLTHFLHPLLFSLFLGGQIDIYVYLSRLLRLQSRHNLPNANHLLSAQRILNPLQRHLSRADRNRHDGAHVRSRAGAQFREEDWAT